MDNKDIINNLDDGNEDTTKSLIDKLSERIKSEKETHPEEEPRVTEGYKELLKSLFE